LALRLYRIDAQSLWNDEGTSVAVAQRDLVTIARDAARDIHPPLYYWLLSAWVRLAGTSEAAVRTLSAFLGVALVMLTYALGRNLVGSGLGMAAAFLAAINPFQVYYAQEARMYMLLAVWSALAVYAALRWSSVPSVDDGTALQAISSSRRPLPQGRRKGSSQRGWGIVYVLASVGGLYTHYAFPMILVAVNLAMVLDIVLRWRKKPKPTQVSLTPTSARFRPGQRFWAWLGLHVPVTLLFIPWFPVAYRQLTTWPNPSEATATPSSLASVLLEIWRWAVLGPTLNLEHPGFPLLLLAVVVLVGMLYLGIGFTGSPIRESRSRMRLLVLVLWLGVPLLLLVVLRLYREAYLKFLLVSTPALTCLLACGLLGLPSMVARVTGTARLARLASRFVQLAAAMLILVLNAWALWNYYTVPAYARDDYRGIAAYIEAVSRPGDTVLLNAPGQQEVFRYYYQGDLPIHPLPESRPLDPAATEGALQQLALPGGRIFAVLWATDESDPGRLIEGWLDSRAYKAFDSWYGDVRLAVYAVPERMPEEPDHAVEVPLQSAETPDEIVLLGYSLLGDRLAAGDIVQITLFWRADRVPDQRYKVFLHVLDADNHIVGQRDTEPGGGARLTTLWTPGETVVDNHGVPIHPATPPGEYRVEAGMYNLNTGQRLVTAEGEGQIWLEPLIVSRPSAPPPTAALGMQYPEQVEFGELVLMGYDAHKLGHPEWEPLRPGDVLHLNLYWRSAAKPTGDWLVEISLVDSRDQDRVRATLEPVAGYPTSSWRAGDIWRGQLDLVVPSDAPAGRYRLRVQPMAPNGTQPGVLLSQGLRVSR
jgi:uncharacterized membrane protein